MANLARQYPFHQTDTQDGHLSERHSQTNLKPVKSLNVIRSRARIPSKGSRLSLLGHSVVVALLLLCSLQGVRSLATSTIQWWQLQQAMPVVTHYHELATNQQEQLSASLEELSQPKQLERLAREQLQWATEKERLVKLY